MQGKGLEGIGRRLCGLGLLVMLAACAYIGTQGEERATVSVAVARTEYLPANQFADTSEGMAQRLADDRQREIDMLKEIAGHDQADGETRDQALLQLKQIAERMEIEAQVNAMLMQMGIAEPCVICGAQMLTIVLAEEEADQEEERLRIIDAVCSLTGYEPADTKIILTKN